jgi:hypothetical protein
MATHNSYRMEQKLHLATLDSIVLQNVITEATTPLASFFQIDLHAAVMGIRDTRDPTFPCFLGLDQQKDDPKTWIVSVRDRQTQEGIEVSRMFGLLFSHTWGPRVWTEWFTENYKAEQTAQYKYDAALCKYVSRASDIYDDLRNTSFFQSLYDIDMAEIENTPCIISNLSVHLPGYFKSPAVLRNAEGEALATTIHDRPEVLRTVFTAEALGEDGWEYLDEEEDKVLVLETAVQVNTTAAESKSAEKPAPNSPISLDKSSKDSYDSAWSHNSPTLMESEPSTTLN